MRAPQISPKLNFYKLQILSRVLPRHSAAIANGRAAVMVLFTRLPLHCKSVSCTASMPQKSASRRHSLRLRRLDCFNDVCMGAVQ